MKIRAYHNTTSSFDKFDESFIGKNDYGYAGRGFYFMRKQLSGKDTYGHITITVEITFNNPYTRIGAGGFSPYSWIPDKAKEIEKINRIMVGRSSKKASVEWTKEAIKLGYDGFIDECDGGGEVVAFCSDQIQIIDIEVRI